MEPEYCPICEDIMEPDDVTGEIRCMTEHAPKGVPMPLITDAKDERRTARKVGHKDPGTTYSYYIKEEG